MQVAVQDDLSGFADIMQLDASVWDDSRFGGDGAVGLRLAFDNTSGQAVEECSLRFNQLFRAPLDDLEVYKGFFGDNRPRGRADIAPGETVAFTFHHDNNNYVALRRADGLAYGDGSPPKLVTLSCGNRAATWNLEKERAAQR